MLPIKLKHNLFFKWLFKMGSITHTGRVLSPSLKYLLGVVITHKFHLFHLLWNARGSNTVHVVSVITQITLNQPFVTTLLFYFCMTCYLLPMEGLFETLWSTPQIKSLYYHRAAHSIEKNWGIKHHVSFFNDTIKRK